MYTDNLLYIIYFKFKIDKRFKNCTVSHIFYLQLEICMKEETKRNQELNGQKIEMCLGASDFVVNPCPAELSVSFFMPPLRSE